MRKMKITLFLLCYCYAISCMADTVYKIKDLGGMPGGANASVALDVNNKGQVVGEALIDKGSTQAFIWKNDKMTPLNNLDTLPYSSPNGINDNGLVTGIVYIDGDYKTFIWSSTDQSVLYIDNYGSCAINNAGQLAGIANERAGIWENNSITPLTNLPGVNLSIANDINESGQSVGFTRVGLNTMATLWQDNKAINLGVLNGGDYSEALAVNDSGLITGISTTLNYMHSFAWKDGVMTDIWDRNESVLADDINNRGEVVGKVGEVNTDGYAFIWTQQDGLLDLNSLLDESGNGWNLISATAINDIGQIVGCGINPEGYKHAYLITPVPEPATLSLIGIGVLMMRKRLRKK